MSRREQELLQQLEVIRRSGERITITEFARRAGYRNKSALRHFRVLKRELHRILVQEAGRRGLSAPSDVRELQEKLERSERTAREQARQLERIPELEAKIGQLRGRCERLRHENGQLRMMVSALAAHVVQRSEIPARAIEAELAALAASMTGTAGSDVASDDHFGGEPHGTH